MTEYLPSTKIEKATSPNAMPGIKSNTATGPKIVPATKNDTGTVGSIAPARKRDTELQLDLIFSWFNGYLTDS